MLGGGHVKYTDPENKPLSDEQIKKHQGLIVEMHLNTFKEAAQLYSSNHKIQAYKFLALKNSLQLFS